MIDLFGGAERDRTAGLLVANEALSQLSYSPTVRNNFSILAASGKSANRTCRFGLKTSLPA
jgi:hypothetical protein